MAVLICDRFALFRALAARLSSIRFFALLMFGISTSAWDIHKSNQKEYLRTSW
jgi:hypothetical protein